MIMYGAQRLRRDVVLYTKQYIVIIVKTMRTVWAQINN